MYRRIIRTLVAAGTAAVAVGAAAAAGPGSAAAAGPGAMAAPARGNACVLKPSEHVSDLTEWRGCLQVTATLSRVPAVNERAELAFTVRAAVARGVVQVKVELSPNLRWVTPPVGMAVTSGPSQMVAFSGLAQGAELSRPFAAGQSVTYRGVVEAVSAGPARVDVRATADPARLAETASEPIFMTVGTTPASSRFGLAVDRRAVPYTGPAPQAAPAGRPEKAIAPQDRSHVDGMALSAAGGRACATGSFTYTNLRGLGEPANGWRVEAWDRDNGSDAHDFLAGGVLDRNGRFTLCFDNADGSSRGQDVYIKFISDNDHWRVQNLNGSVFVFTTLVDGEVLDGETADFGVTASAPVFGGVGRIMEAVRRIWISTPGTCWDTAGPCRKVVVMWEPDSTDGSFYSSGENKVHLLGIHGDYPNVIAHEASHAIMDDVYEDDFPPIPGCNPHNIPDASSAGCAWVEGFAEWLAVWANDRNPVWVGGPNPLDRHDLEAATWGTPGWDNGDTVEGRVAGALIDLTDSTNDGTDNYSENIGNIWSTFQIHVSDTFAEFWANRTIDQFPVGDAPLNSLLRNTIDY